MAQNDVLPGQLDPEIAALLGTDQIEQEEIVYDLADFESDDILDDITPRKAEEMDILAGGFPEITKMVEDVPHTAFEDPNYYKNVLAGEGDIVQRLHGTLQKYLNCKDPKDKGVFRLQIIPAYWEFLASVARKAPERLIDPKKFFLRFALLHPTFLKENDKTLFAKVILENTHNQPVYYLDEWFKAVGTGVIKNSATDEVSTSKSSASVKLQQLLEKAQGKFEGAKALLRAKDTEKQELEKALVNQVSQITVHAPLEGIPGINACYSEGQRRIFNEIQELSKGLLKSDREQEILIREYNQARNDVTTISQKMEETGAVVEVDVGAVNVEFETIKQMAKMTIGRQGNHFPILTSDYFHCLPHEVGTRENVLNILSWIESIDPEVFYRVHRNQVNRIAPFVILIPTYGDMGMCWEPFDRHNRATSRSRIAIPMYPRNLRIAALTAVGDLRWQVAKEKASYYWMEEGITGNYYQWFTKNKLKGDLKDYFVQDYINWMTRESEGVQKLDKELRGIFWRYMPFSQTIKEKLKTRNLVYQELYQRDLNRSMSDGY